ncbi:malate dehydrogenase [Citrobacter sp. Cu233]|uniref:malate dehydrogenase n=1 Tax=Citrobacter sp. Cu233 TaxID=2985160 RepID=UPI00257629BB|nr:malate dehydrogenase [Citrobacter sp. Cu233]MDM2935029.1 malate dehydrogenase [Citrobacter sp. Cu233]
MKVTLLGAAGGIGQALSLLLKLHMPEGAELALYDISTATPGIAVDLSHIPTDVHIHGYCGAQIQHALEGANIVIVCAGIARKPGMDRSDLFSINANIIHQLIGDVAKICPDACIGIITNPVNTTVAIAANVLQKAGVYDKNKLFGITTLDVIRANTFVAQMKGCSVRDIEVPVIGGHSGVTILPLFSQLTEIKLSDDDIRALTDLVQNAGTRVVEAKAGAGSATLSMGQAAARFCLSLLRALNGEQGIVECAYVEGGSQYARFFAQPVELGVNGVSRVIALTDLSRAEQDALEAMQSELRKDIAFGERFVCKN